MREGKYGMGLYICPFNYNKDKFEELKTKTACLIVLAACMG